MARSIVTHLEEGALLVAREDNEPFTHQHHDLLEEVQALVLRGFTHRAVRAGRAVGAEGAAGVVAVVGAAVGVDGLALRVELRAGGQANGSHRHNGHVRHQPSLVWRVGLVVGDRDQLHVCPDMTPAVLDVGMAMALSGGAASEWQHVESLLEHPWRALILIRIMQQPFAIYQRLLTFVRLEADLLISDTNKYLLECCNGYTKCLGVNGRLLGG